MKSNLCHIFLNILNPEKSFPYYKEFLKYFDYEIEFENDQYLGMTNGVIDIWLQHTDMKYRDDKFHRKKTGINHFAFRVDTKDDVDKFYSEFLKSKNIKVLYNTPKPFPENTENYYAVYFEDPDRLKLEVCFY
ncbi:hypothetical protein LCGC14_2964920 [marine sediment metagenome]|uniref:VOC domain-containing protein n=1 Tax=marine sediment metagenome TaxID=412755 RepID=A0A0F8XC20_9ZZZZ